MQKMLQGVKSYALVMLLMMAILVVCPIEAKAAELPEIESVKTSQNAYSDEKGYMAVSVGVSFTISEKSSDKNLVFEVYRSTSKNGTYKKAGEVSAVSSKKKYTFVDKSRYLMPKKTYYYKVVAVSGDAKGEYSSPAKIKLKLVDAKVSGTGYNAKDNCISISFSDPFEVNNGIDDYQIDSSKILNIYVVYRSESKDGEYEEIGTAPVVSGVYYDTDIEEGKVYYYKVKSGYYNQKTEKRVLGNFVNAGFRFAGDFSVTSKVTDGKVKLKWTKIEGAKYYVYKGLSTFGEILTKTTKNSYTYDLDGKASEDFRVVVYLKVDGEYQETSMGAKIIDNVVQVEEEKEEEQINHPVTVTQLSTSKVKISWPKAEDAEYYNVYRVTGYKYAEHIDLEEEWTMRWYVGKTTSTSIKDSKVMPGMEYRYIVEPMGGTSSSTTEYMYSDSYTLTIDKAVIKSVKNKSSKSATITWEKIKGADEYVIYRSTKKNGTYKEVATVTGTSYKDKGLTKGKTYYYKIKAVNVNDFGIATDGEFSKIKKIKISK